MSSVYPFLQFLICRVLVARLMTGFYKPNKGIHTSIIPEAMEILHSIIGAQIFTRKRLGVDIYNGVEKFAKWLPLPLMLEFSGSTSIAELRKCCQRDTDTIGPVRQQSLCILSVFPWPNSTSVLSMSCLLWLQSTLVN